MRVHALLTPAALALLLHAAPARAEEAAPPITPVVQPPAPPEAPAAAGLAAEPLRNASLPRLTLDVPRHALITSGALLLTLGLKLGEERLVPSTCRWCEPTQLDRWGRQALRWSDPEAAATASDLLVLAVPVGAGVLVGLRALEGPAGQREALEDVVVIAEAVSLTTLATMGVKIATARERPYAWAAGGSVAADGRESFWSGHTCTVFTVAAAYTQVARLRGRSGWQWQSALLFAGAAATGWLRVAADRHWLTDAGVGALVGTAAGLMVPLLAFREEGAEAPALALVPAPGGFGLIF